MVSLARSKRVLVVDDDPDVIEFLETALRHSGCEVSTACDGDEALTLANELQPQVVLLDIGIPGQDGWLVCTKLKLLSSAPAVVLITGSSAPALDGFASFVRADGVMKKPFSAEEVTEKVNEMVAANCASA